MAYSRCSINNNWLMDKSMNGWGIMTLYALDGVLCLSCSLWGTHDRFQAEKWKSRLTQIKYSKMTKKPVHCVSLSKAFWNYVWWFF